MLQRLLATHKGRSYIDVVSDRPATDIAYWQAMAELNAVVLFREGIPLSAVSKTGPIVQDLARVLAAVRRTGI